MTGTPSRRADLAFLPVALSSRPKRVPFRLAMTSTVRLITSASMNTLTGNSALATGSHESGGKGGVDCALPPSGGCHGPEMK